MALSAFNQFRWSGPRAFLLLVPFLWSITIEARYVEAQQTDLISRGAVIPWKQDVASPDRIASDVEEVRFKNSQGHLLRGWYFPKAEATHTILVCSGNTGNISLSLPYAKLLLDDGFNVLLFDYQGFGGSEGIASVMSLCTDTEAAFKFLLSEKKLKPDDIGVFGISLGSILALMIANEQKAAAVAVEDVFIPEQMLDRFGVREDDPNVMKGMAIRLAKKLLLGRVNPIQNAKACQCPVFLMHGLNDRLLPFFGTVEVAKALKPEDRVWLMDRAGHAPETLEVNDREYSAQLTRFFHDSMNGRHVSLNTKLSSQRVNLPQRSGQAVSMFKVSVTLASGSAQHAQQQPLQLVFVDADARYRVIRAMMRFGETRRWYLPFDPIHCSATEFQYVSPIKVVSAAQVKDGSSKGVHEWKPELSEFSVHRAEHVDWTLKIFRTGPVAHYLMTNYGKNFYRAARYLKAYPDSDAQRLLQFLKVDADRPPEICARYARLLARLYCWPTSPKMELADQLSKDTERVKLAEKMLSLLPRNRDEYFELGNASFQYQFRDTVIADALFRLARIRLRDGQVDPAQQLLRLHVQLLPKKVTTNLTEERISTIQTVSDLDASD